MDETTIYRLLLTLFLIILFFVFWIWRLYNRLVRQSNQIEADLSNINIQIKRKADLIERLIGLVREYSKHEKETFENVTAARSQIDSSKQASESAKVDNILSESFRSIALVVENYPKLQASDNYKELNKEIKDTEDKIALYRQEYNISVQDYNNTVEVFPNLLITSLLGFNEAQFFQIETPATV